MMENLPAERWSHLIGKSTSDDHAVRLSWAGPENNPKAIQIVPGSPSVHHLNGTASKPKGHGPNGPTTSPIHQVINFGDQIAYSAALAVAGGCAPPYLVGEEEEDDSKVAAEWIGAALRAEEVKGSCVEATLAAIAIFVSVDYW